MNTRIRTRVPAALAGLVTLASAAGLVTAAGAPAAAATPTCNSPVWKVQFFANTTFGGTPRKTACDAAISENYGSGHPSGVSLPNDDFSVRWSLTRDFGSGGPFTFAAEAQDGIRVYLDGSRKINLWKDVSSTREKSVNVTIPKGKHTLRVDFVAWKGKANVKFAYTPRTTASVDKVKPLAPSGASVAYDREAGAATLRWTANKEMDLAGYRVYRRPSLGTTWTKVSGTGLVTKTAFTDRSAPVTGAKFGYEVRAVDKAGNESAGSADVYVTTVDTIGPPAPTGLTVRYDYRMAYLRWDAPPESGVVRWEVWAALDEAGPYHLISQPDDIVDEVNAPENSTRYYRVQAFDRFDNPSPFSAVVADDGVDRTGPWLSPTDVKAVARPGSTDVHWSMHSAFFMDWDTGGSYRLYRSPGHTLDKAALTRVTCAEGSDFWLKSGHCVDLTMDQGAYYTYAVAAVDPSGNESALSAPLTVRTGDQVAPAPLTGVTATPRADGIQLSWDASTADDRDDSSPYWVWTGVPRADGTVEWTGVSTCDPVGGAATTVVCKRAADMPETRVYAVVADDRWSNRLRPDAPGVMTVTVTDPYVRPAP
ncbi:PA14 domain-containing protein [Streptomyces sp. NPDC048717]|uniref:PA14 domain-containing protein n=1 Tax=Streptomyces sp. NPDC048717 TaxID=3154928 RepID=UPI003423E247